MTTRACAGVTFPSESDVMPVDYRDLAVEELADSEAALRAEIRTLVDLIADLAFEKFLARRAFQSELFARLQGDAALARCQRKYLLLQQAFQWLVIARLRRGRHNRPPSGTEG